MTARTARTPGDDQPGDVLGDLLKRTGQADRAAFGELYDRAAARVFATIRRLLVDHAQSEEVPRRCSSRSGKPLAATTLIGPA